MKLKTIVGACAFALASHAYAIGPGVAPTVTIYEAGSSAQEDSIQAIADSLFIAGTVDNYTDQVSSLGTNYRAYYGTIKPQYATANVPAGSNVLIIERAAGGSAHGIFPLALGQNDSFMAINAASCVATGNAYPAATFSCGTGGVPNNTVNAPADVGVSDEEPALFQADNLYGTTYNPLTAAQAANITSVSEFHVIQGIAATNTLAGQLTSITSAQWAAILDGSYTNWSELGLPAGPIVLITRAPGSGTKAANNAKFLYLPCSSASGGAISPEYVGSITVGTQNAATVNGNTVTGLNALNPNNAPTTAPFPATAWNALPAGTVLNESSSGNVQLGLDFANNAGIRAIGILGREYDPGANASAPGGNDAYYWLAIDGVALGTGANTSTNSRQNAGGIQHAINGSYPFFYTQSLQYRVVPVGAAPAGTAGTAKGDMVQAFISQAINPAVSTTVPGIALDPNNYTVGVGGGFDQFAAEGTRFGNSCSPLQMQN